MNLSATYYDSIMREYDNQRLENMHDLNMRTQEIYKKYPAIKQLDTQISELAENFAASFTKEGSMSFDEYRKKLADLRMEKEALLKCYHIAPETLNMQYCCKDCQDTGMIGEERCHCFKQAVVDLLYAQSGLASVLEKVSCCGREETSSVWERVSSCEAETVFIRFSTRGER